VHEYNPIGRKKRRSTKEEDGTNLYGSRPVADADIF